MARCILISIIYILRVVTQFYSFIFNLCRLSTCAFTVCVSVKTGVKITVNFYVKIDVNFAVKAVNFYTVNFYSVNFRAVIFYDFSAFWGWKCWRIFLAVLDDGGAAHTGLLGNLGIRGFRMLGKVCEHFILLHLTGSLSVLTARSEALRTRFPSRIASIAGTFWLNSQSAMA